MAKATSYATYFPASVRIPHEFQGAERWRVIDINTATNTDVRATGTYGFCTFDVGEVVTRGYGVVLTTFTSTSNDGTMKFLVNDNTSTGDLNTAVTMDGTTKLIAGHILQLQGMDYEDVVTLFGYNASVALQLEWTIATHAITAGRMMLYVATINVYNLLNNG